MLHDFLKTLVFLITLIACVPIQAQARGGWPLWEQFRQNYISDDGRVIDRRDGRKITTSEGQAYALFFALVANDQGTFSRLIDWTKNNLIRENAGSTLPGWLWGHDLSSNKWTLLDNNSASDADVWLGWTLLEAGQLWNRVDYTEFGKQILTSVRKKETSVVSGVGRVLLPGQTGFVHKNTWRLNPSYLPPFMVPSLAAFDPVWKEIGQTNMRLLRETSPHGFAPDWAEWETAHGWRFYDAATTFGSYDAIRVYLWVGMMSRQDPALAGLLAHFQPFSAVVTRQGLPPEDVEVATGRTRGKGNIGFMGALLPFLQESPDFYILRSRVLQYHFVQDEYYSYILCLFGEGWSNHRFRFDIQGHVVPDWS